VRHVIGYMPDFFGVYKDMEVTEYLDFFGACYKIPTAQREKTVNDVLELVGLSEKKGALIGALSRGMQQRLGLARVLLHEPQVLLLDEPASGLDPRARIEMRALLKELRNMGKTILVSSHILPELADICNKIGIIERGKLLFDGDVESAIRKVRKHTVLDVVVGNGLGHLARERLEGNADILSVQLKDDETLVVTLNDGVSDGSFIAEILVKNGFRLKMLKEEEIDLEDVFMAITKGITN